VYLAGPLFSATERQWNVSIRNILTEFCDVYLPQEDGALLVDLVANGMPVDEAKNIIFARDIEAIERCNVLLLVMDGRVIDEGATFELGYAYCRGKICIGLKTDVRSLLPIGNNPMIECALRKTFNDVDSVCEWIKNRGWEGH
jgi:nucleoside 2-deoxyribosyltransferase